MIPETFVSRTLASLLVGSILLSGCASHRSADDLAECKRSRQVLVIKGSEVTFQQGRCFEWVFGEIKERKW